MLISPIQSVKGLINIKNEKNRNNIKRSHNSDVFIKQAVSFKGNNDYESIDLEFLGCEDAEKMFASYISILKYRDVFNDLNKLGTKDIYYFNSNLRYGKLTNPRGFSFALNLLGIQKCSDLSSFTKTFYTNNDVLRVFNNKPTEAMYSFSHLDNKSHFGKYPELIEYLVQPFPPEDFSVINNYCSFLDKIGLNNFKDFDEKFSHLKSRFNDFEDMDDKIEAVDYLMETYDDKISYIDRINEGVQPYLKQNPESVYAGYNQFIDYIYSKDRQNHLSNGQDEYFKIIPIMLNASKLKNMGLKKLSSVFNNYDSIADKVNFYKFLVDNNVSVSDFNNLFSRAIMKDSNPVNIIENKDRSIDELKIIFNNDKNQANNFYLKFSDAVNAGYSDGINFADYTKDLYNLTSRFNIKNQDGLLKLYNKFNKTKAKLLTSEELSEFVSLFKYSDSNNIEKEAVKQKTSVVGYLKTIKSDFEKYDEQITNHIINDLSGFFTDKSSLEIYKEYKDLIQKNPFNVSDVLCRISDFNFNDRQNYKILDEFIDSVGVYFDSREEINEFIYKNGIKFSKEESDYRNNCLTILAALYDKNNIAESKTKIKKLSNLQFLPNSKNTLSEFLKDVPKKRYSEVLNFIIDRKISKTNELYNFNHNLGCNRYFDENIFEFLKTVPESVSTEEVQNIISDTNELLSQQLDILKINSADIKNITYNDILENNLFALVNNLMEIPEGFNLLIKFIPDGRKKSVDNLDTVIPVQIAKCHNKVSTAQKFDGSFVNIERILDLDESVFSSRNKYNIKKIRKKIPENFEKFVNKMMNTKIFDNLPAPELSVHAALRIIDRFILDENSTLKDLDKPQAIEKYKDLLRSAYTWQELSFNPTGSEILFSLKYNGDDVHFVLNDSNKIITVIKKD